MAKPLPCPRPPALRLRQRPPPRPARLRDRLRGAEPSPDAPLRPSCPRSQGLRPLSPTFVHKVDGLPARTPPRFMRRSWRPESLLGCSVGGQGSGGCRVCLQVVEGLTFLPRGRQRGPGRRPGGPHRLGEPRHTHVTQQTGDITRGLPRSGRSRVETLGNAPGPTGKWHTRGQ